MVVGLKTLANKQEDVLTIAHNQRLYFSALSAAAAATLIGYDSAFLGGTLALPAFRREFGLNRQTSDKVNTLEANIVSFYQVGCFVGALWAYFLGNYCGRKIGLVVAISVFIIGAILTMIAKSTLGLTPIYSGRVLTGLGIGAISNLTPIYLAEISLPAIRGRLVGGIVGFWINYGIAQNRRIQGPYQYLIPFGVQLIPAGLALFGTTFIIKESPRWLLSRGRRSQARKNLSWLRKLDEKNELLEKEFCMMEQSLSEINDKIGHSFWGPFKALFGNRSMRLRLVLACSLFMLQNGTGINAINYYSPKVFQSIGIKGTSGVLLSTGVFGVIKTLSTFVWLLYIVDYVDRTTLLMTGAFFGGIMMYGIGAFVAITKPLEHPSSTLSYASGGALVMFYLWTICYSPTWNPTPWVWAAEAFPTHVRTLSQACVAASNWLFNFLVVRSTPQMFSAMNYGVYLLFGSMMMLSVIYVKLFVPELRGLPLESIDKAFEHHFSAQQFTVFKSIKKNKNRNLNNV
ncbi:hypothetical protein O181_028882 [Austropuccinia psidii MF-1]|uniref:Quinate transporter n=1 Tax=Austropuccinia psidii MF-1 TaxID=1389203 RepID=A0A9Q3CVH3_9BASI|nr:hypothetical protein [Austropuccinia psidii MF-1]